MSLLRDGFKKHDKQDDVRNMTEIRNMCVTTNKKLMGEGNRESRGEEG